MLSWSPSVDGGGSGLAGYEVFRSASPVGPWAKVATTTATTWVDRTVSRLRVYWYVVRAYDQAGNRSANSPAAAVVVI
jgi:endoglucanase